MPGDGPCVCCNAADGVHDYHMHANWRTAMHGLAEAAATPVRPLSTAFGYGND